MNNFPFLARIAAVTTLLWMIFGLFAVPALLQSGWARPLFEGQEPALDLLLIRWRRFVWIYFFLLAFATLLLVRTRDQPWRTAWEQYWFRPQSTEWVGLFRLVLVGLQLLLIVTQDVYNLERVRESAILPSGLYEPVWLLKLIILPFGSEARPSLEAMTAIYWVAVISGMTAWIGWKTNASLLLFAFSCAVLQAAAYSFGDLHHPEALLIMTLFFLALSPSGASLSLDHWLRTRRAPESTSAATLKTSHFAAWPGLLTQWLLAIVYLDSGIRKVWIAGSGWINGYTLQFYLFNDGIKKQNALALWLGQFHELAQVLSIATVVFELTFFLAVMFPRLLWIYVPTGLMFHFGNCLTGIACFYQFIALYIVFLPSMRAIARPSFTFDPIKPAPVPK